MNEMTFAKNEYAEYIALKTKMEALKRTFEQDNYCANEDFYKITGYKKEVGENDDKEA